MARRISPRSVGDRDSNKDDKAGARRFVTRLLLDYPWELIDALGHDPVPSKVVESFLRLLERTRLDPVPFVGNDEYLSLCNNIGDRRGRNRFGPLMRLLNHCIRANGSPCRAVPVDGPENRRDS